MNTHSEPRRLHYVSRCKLSVNVQVDEANMKKRFRNTWHINYYHPLKNLFCKRRDNNQQLVL